MNAPQNRIEEDEDGSMILEEEIDENYEPTQEEIVEYAQFLGMDLQKDKEFFYIAREGLKAPLPDIWKPAKNRKGDIYYINMQTQKRQWEHPCDEYYKKLFQDAKKKKNEGGIKVQQKQTTSKFKSNLPMANNLQQPKNSPLPLIKEVGSQQRLDTGGSSENQNTLSLNHPDFSIDTSPIASQQKKLVDKSNPAQSQKLGSILNELKDDFSGAEDVAKIDKEYEDKAQEYQKEKDIEAKEMKEKNALSKDSHEKKLKSNMGKDLEDYKVKMLEKTKSVKKTLEEEKKKVHRDLELEYKKETEAAIKKMDQDHPNVKRKLDLQEARELDKAMEGEEERIIKQIENRIMDLTKLHKELETDQLKMKERRIQKQKELEYQIDEEQLKIENEYKKQLEVFERNEIAAQRTEIENYKTNLKVQLTEEKSALAIAEKQKKSLALAREVELKEEYDQKHQEGKARIDQEINEKLKEYEQGERNKKDKMIQLHRDNDLKAERDKRQAAHQIEIGKLQESFKSRLETYERPLKLKLESEKQLIEQENSLVLERYKNDVENIRTNISNREDIVNQIKKTQEKNEDVNREINELDRKSEQLKRENEILQKKLEDLRNRQKMQSKLSAATAIRDLEQKIQDADRHVKQMSRPNISVQNNSASHQKLSKTLPNSSNSKLNSSYYKIMDDIEEIKTILTTKGDEKEKIHSGIATPKKMMSSRILSPTTLKGMLSDKNRLYKSKVDMHQDNYEKWLTIYNEELDNIEGLKNKLEECKNILAKKQSEILQNQDRLKASVLDYKSSANKTLNTKSDLRKLKANLDKEVQKINQNMHNLREADLQLEMKEKLLAGLGSAIRRINIEDLDGQVQKMYKRYQEIEVKIPNLVEEKRFQFYETWKDIVDNQLAMDGELSDTERHFEPKPQNESMSDKFSTLDFKSSIFQHRLESMLSPKSVVSPKYSYDNLMRVLDIQSKSEVLVPETSMLQRYATEAQEDRAKIKTVFTNHSDWLKNIKQKLNHQLYDRTASFSTRSTTMAHQNTVL